MILNINTKNLNASENLYATIEKKFDKLGKYFSDDIEAKVMLSQERGRQKVEATINARGFIFRAEEAENDVYDAVDRVVEKLSSQMSRFKDKIQKKNKGGKGVILEAVPDYTEPEEEIVVVKTKKFQLEPMNTDEAIVQMELLQHNFFIFMNMETDTVNVVYKRNDGNYGLLETVY
ncbi:MAG: ribosome-associated translation inhibitor RaiA [Firmicutes bacterium]|nr:ribosome-associated translation inhibitor RaiA [Bacillota bacterium]